METEKRNWIFELIAAVKEAPGQFLTYRQLAEKLGCSPTHVMNLIKEYDVKRPTRISKSKIKYVKCSKCARTTSKVDEICSKCSRASLECAGCGKNFSLTKSVYKRKASISTTGNFYHNRSCWSQRKK